MKRFFTTVLIVSLFMTVNSVWATGDNKKDTKPAKVENVEKKATTAKETKSACCAEVKEGCAASCCATKATESKSCCSETKATAAKATTDCCTNTTTAKETQKSSGKKSN
jgi:hypothetical protein